MQHASVVRCYYICLNCRHAACTNRDYVYQVLPKPLPQVVHESFLAAVVFQKNKVLHANAVATTKSTLHSHGVQINCWAACVAVCKQLTGNVVGETKSYIAAGSLAKIALMIWRSQNRNNRFRFVSCRDRLEVRTLRCGRNNPGSNPGLGIFFLLLHVHYCMYSVGATKPTLFYCNFTMCFFNDAYRTHKTLHTHRIITVLFWWACWRSIVWFRTFICCCHFCLTLTALLR